jgi:hypothetical protein
MKIAIIFASLLTSAVSVHADAFDETMAAQQALNRIVFNTKILDGSPLGHDLKETPANACADIVAKAKSGGVPADAEFRFIKVGKVLFAELPAKVCAPYERVVHTAEAAQMLATTKDGKACATEMDRLLKFPIGDVEIEARDITFKLGDAKKKICDPVAKGQPISKEEKARARDAVAAPYVEAGIGGGKLNVCIANGPNLRGVDGLTLEPKKIKRAALLFVVKGPVEGVYTLQRLTFKGDEIDKVTDKSFNEEPKPADYR